MTIEAKLCSRPWRLSMCCGWHWWNPANHIRNKMEALESKKNYLREWTRRGTSSFQTPRSISNEERGGHPKRMPSFKEPSPITITCFKIEITCTCYNVIDILLLIKCEQHWKRRASCPFHSPCYVGKSMKKLIYLVM